MPRYDPITGGPWPYTLYTLQIRLQAYSGANFALRRHGPRSANANSIIQLASGGRLRQQDGVTPIVRRWDRRTPKEGKGPTRGAREDERMHVAAAITFGRKFRLKELMACPCPGSAVAPLPR